MRFEEAIVHIVSNDPVGTKRLTDFFCIKRIEGHHFQNRC